MIPDLCSAISRSGATGPEVILPPRRMDDPFGLHEALWEAAADGDPAAQGRLTRAVCSKCGAAVPEVTISKQSKGYCLLCAIRHCESLDAVHRQIAVFAAQTIVGDARTLIDNMSLGGATNFTDVSDEHYFRLMDFVATRLKTLGKAPHGGAYLKSVSFFGALLLPLRLSDWGLPPPNVNAEISHNSLVVDTYGRLFVDLGNASYAALFGKLRENDLPSWAQKLNAHDLGDYVEAFLGMCHLVCEDPVPEVPWGVRANRLVFRAFQFLKD